MKTFIQILILGLKMISKPIRKTLEWYHFPHHTIVVHGEVAKFYQVMWSGPFSDKAVTDLIASYKRKGAKVDISVHGYDNFTYDIYPPEFTDEELRAHAEFPGKLDLTKLELPGIARIQPKDVWGIGRVQLPENEYPNILNSFNYFDKSPAQ